MIKFLGLESSVIKALATFVTIVAALMTAVAAWDRGGTPLDKGLLVAMSVVIVLAVHLLPAISRRPSAWLVWTGCLLCAVYGHLTFLTHASQRASESLAQQSVLKVGTERQFDLTKEALAQIKARPVAEVAAELAVTQDKRARAALTVEIAAGKKAEKLREDLVRLSAVSTEAQVNGSVDPVTQKLAELFESSQGAVSVVIGLTFAMLLELIGALLWVEALRPSAKNAEKVSDVTLPVTRPTVVSDTPVTRSATTTATSLVTPVTTQTKSNATLPATPAVTQNESHAETFATSQEIPTATPTESAPENSNVTSLKSAIEAGKCKATVNGIRAFLGCSQSRALELRRALEI